MRLEDDQIRPVVTRLKRAHGHLGKVIAMMEEGADCEEVLTQLAAVNKALDAVALALLDDHLHHCVSNAASGGPEELEAKITEASAAIARLVKS